ncbi:hypothetical protein [Xanthobacter sp. 126]|uniref:hypothetical protein n=1 Tax=Xanthobacter sp. 126 TaxID=1131814 RepID=UPI0012DE5044|nr:hypothetical protein [Xanthobacter sp. 126]
MTLVPSLGAAVALCRSHKDFAALLEQVAKYDLEACTAVVHHGLARTSDEWEQSAEEVYETGMVELAPHLIRFVGILANGGKPLPKEEEKPSGPFGA